MKSALLFLALLVGTTFNGKAQSGNNQLQASGQVSFPVSTLKNFAKTGYGFAAKGLFGFGKATQQATIEAGYAHFSLDQPEGYATDYTAMPVYLGYRYLFGNVFVEPQLGIAIDRFKVPYVTIDESTTTRFGWAASIGYLVGPIELGAKYQSSVTQAKDLNFVSIRLGYNFKL